MIAGTIRLTNFDYGALQGETPEGQKIKGIVFKDKNSGVSVELIMLPEEFDAILQHLKGSPIIEAHELPKK
jgi:hypothetical protein